MTWVTQLDPAVEAFMPPTSLARFLSTCVDGGVYTVQCRVQCVWPLDLLQAAQRGGDLQLQLLLVDCEEGSCRAAALLVREHARVFWGLEEGEGKGGILSPAGAASMARQRQVLMAEGAGAKLTLKVYASKEPGVGKGKLAFQVCGGSKMCGGGGGGGGGEAEGHGM